MATEEELAWCEANRQMYIDCGRVAPPNEDEEEEPGWERGDPEYCAMERTWWAGLRWAVANRERAALALEAPEEMLKLHPLERIDLKHSYLDEDED